MANRMMAQDSGRRQREEISSCRLGQMASYGGGDEDQLYVGMIDDLQMKNFFSYRLGLDGIMQR